MTRIRSLNSLEKFLNRRQSALLVVYNPACPFCKQIMPMVNRLEKQSRKIAMVKDHVARDVLDFPGVPTYFLIRNGEVVKRWSGASEQAVGEFVRRALTIIQ